MKSFSTALVMVLLLVVFVVPLAATLHCEGDHHDESATECECLCHSTSAFTSLEPTRGLTVLLHERAPATDMVFIERLSIDDIDRPPTSV